MTPVVLRLSRSNIRRWHASLAGALTKAGMAVRIELVNSPAPPCPFEALRPLERRLFHIEPAAAGERIAALPDAFPPVSVTDAEAVVLNCSGGGRPDLRTLVPDFAGDGSEAGLAAALLRHEPPAIGWRRTSDGRRIAGGRTALVSPHVLTQGFDHACARMVDLAIRAVRVLASGAGDGPAAGSPHGSAPVPAASTLLAHALREAGSRALSRLTGRRAPLPRWNVGWRRLPATGGILDTGVLGDTPFTWLPADPARFVADPFAFQHDGRTFVFVEELPFATWRGYISVFEIGADGAPSPLRPVLERPYHLSYPSVFIEDGVIWMIPETGANRTIELYRADPFPDRWVLDRVLIEGIDAADATYFRHGGLSWLAVATADHGASSWDTLSLFHADSLAGPWRAHALNPVLSDPARARPAGWLHDGPAGLIRPAQDCVGGYGAALTLNRVTRLDPEHFEEALVARIAPPPAWSARGLHTITQAGGWEVIDAVF